MTDPLFFGYYTIGTPYADEYATLKRNLEAFGLQHEYVPIEPRGSWLANCAAKAEIVRDFINLYPGRRLVYLDVDSEIKSKPELLWTIDASIAAVRFGGWELLSGVVLFNNARNLRPTIDRWIRLCRQYPERFPGGLLPHFPVGSDAWDQRLLDIAIRQTGVRFAELPPAYNFIFDLSAEKYPGVHPVIQANCASRKYRPLVNTGKTCRKIVVAFPTANTTAANKVLAEWHDKGYGSIVLIDKGMPVPDADDFIAVDGYEGFPRAANALCRRALESGADIVVLAGDDLHPDSRSSVALGGEFAAQFPDGYGVAQPMGDKYGALADGAERAAVSPWIGAEFIRRAYAGGGPYHTGYRHLYADAELWEVAKQKGVLWEWEGVSQYHAHHTRGHKDNLTINQRKIIEKAVVADKTLYYHRKGQGFPGS